MTSSRQGLVTKSQQQQPHFHPLSIDGHKFFGILAVVDSAAVDMAVHVSF